MTFVSVDFETRSTVDLRKTGVYPYAADPSTDIWCMSYAWDEEEGVRTWLPGDAIDPALESWVQAGGELRAWNSGFEVQIWNRIMVPRYGWPTTSIEQWIDTAAEAAAMALPRALGRAAKALGMPEEKDDGGYRLMLSMAKPRCVGAWWMRGSAGETFGPFATSNDAHEYRKRELKRPPKAFNFWKDEDTVVWWSSPERLKKLIEYCEQDVRAEKALAHRLLDLRASEREVFLMTQRMNDRGVPVDVDLVHAAKDMLDFALENANERMRDLTDGFVQSVTKVSRLLEWVSANGVTTDNIRKDTVRDLLETELPENVREVLQIRQDAGKTSTAKLDAFLRCTGDDGRARGLLLYHGASTGRWAGRLIQPQNFPRPEIENVEQYIGMVRDRDYEALLDTEIPVPVLIASMLRSMFCATSGAAFMCADYSQVEARVLAWIAGQEDLVELFRSGGKVYETMASFIFDIPAQHIAKDSFERQIGKNSVLGAGFQMGPDRFAEQVQQQTGIVLDRGDEKVGRPDLAAQAITKYRGLYHKIPQFWREIERAAILAVRTPGSEFTAGIDGKIKFKFHGKFLWCFLPSGRKLAYAKPEVRDRALPKPHEHVEKPTLSYLGVNSMTNQWQRMYSYGGHLTENVVQAMARDLIAGGMLRLELAGYNPILTVHDEVLIETAEGVGDFEQFMELVTTLPAWAGGLPLAGEGWIGQRYRK